jgi:hypothetical protein
MPLSRTEASALPAPSRRTTPPARMPGYAGEKATSTLQLVVVA